jgi:hypothetical protein
VSLAVLTTRRRYGCGVFHGEVGDELLILKTVQVIPVENRSVG